MGIKIAVVVVLTALAAGTYLYFPKPLVESRSPGLPATEVPPPVSQTTDTERALIASADSRATEALREAAGLREENRVLREQLEKLLLEKGSVQQKAREFESRMASLEQELIRLKEENAARTVRSEEEIRQLGVLQREKEGLEERVGTLEAEYNSLLVEKTASASLARSLADRLTEREQLHAREKEELTYRMRQAETRLGRAVKIAARTPSPGEAVPQDFHLARTVVLEMQQDLNALGYSPGPPDGIAGPRTQAAILRFQQDIGIPDGEPVPTIVLLVDRYKRVQEVHPDWREVVAGPRFASWLDEQPPELARRYRDTLRAGTDLHIRSLLDTYKQLRR